VRSIHLAVHVGSECSFLWNAYESQKCAVELNLTMIPSRSYLERWPAKNSPLERAVFNSCKTLKLAQSTRMRGVPHVVCWHEEVGDEITQEFTDKFYRALVRNSTVSSRDYRVAFVDAANEMQNSQRTNGSQQPAISSLQTAASLPMACLPTAACHSSWNGREATLFPSTSKCCPVSTRLD